MQLTMTVLCYIRSHYFGLETITEHRTEKHLRPLVKLFTRGVSEYCDGSVGKYWFFPF